MIVLEKKALTKFAVFAVAALGIGTYLIGYHPAYQKAVHSAKTTSATVSLSTSAKRGHHAKTKASQTTSTATHSAGIAPQHYFSQYRLQRDLVRSKEIALLREVSSNRAATASARQTANLNLVRLAKSKRAEQNIESLALAKGFGKTVAVLHSHSAVVVVDHSKVSKGEVAAIADIVMRVTGLPASSIEIIPKQG